MGDEIEFDSKILSENLEEGDVTELSDEAEEETEEEEEKKDEEEEEL